MRIKIIIPILDPEASFFSDNIPHLQSQTLHPEILIINSGSTIPRGNYEVLDIDKIDFNHANTRNIALQYDADFYLFMTQDALPYDNTLIEKLLEPFENTDVVVSYARQIPYPDADFTEIFARTTNYPAVSKLQSYENLPQLGIKTFFNSDSCAMYRGDYFRKMGGFKPNTNTSEDMEFAARAVMNRKKIAYCADAKVYHSHNFTIKQLWSRYREIGKFFKDNQWILKTVSQFNSTESTGIKQAAKEVFYLLRHQPLLIPRSLMNSVIKYIAFKLNS